MFEPTGTLADIVPSVRHEFQELLGAAAALGMHPHIRTFAGRTCADQDQQLNAGASHVSGCRSWHTMGRAIDLDLSPNTYATYQQLGELWEKQGGFWGGRWKSLFPPNGDYGHFHWGDPDPKLQAVSDELCRSGLSTADCEVVRQQYLASQGFGTPSWPWFIGAGLLLGGVTLMMRPRWLARWF